MPRTDLDVCSQACARVSGQPLDALDEGTPLGAYCLANYPAKRDWALALHRWQFATRIAPLAELASPEQRAFPHVYALPADLAGEIFAYRATASVQGCTLDHFMTEEGVALDSPTAYAEYGARVGEAVWPAPFAEFVVTLFAADIAWFKTQKSLASELRKQAVGQDFDQGVPGGLLLQAMQRDGQNAPERQLGGWDMGPLVEARFCGAAGGFGLRVGATPGIIDFSGG